MPAWLSEVHAVPGNQLNQLLQLVNSPIYDVSVYVQAAYLKGLTKVAFAQFPTKLEVVHLENISSLYVTDSLQLGQDDYEENINRSLFQTLLYEGRKQEFVDKNLFLLFNTILNLNGKYAPQVLAILLSYTSKHSVPEATFRTLEKLLLVASYFDKALLILENIVRCGEFILNKRTLEVFAENLNSQTNSRLRFYTFKLLEQISQNQELPNDVFYQSELVRAGYALECTTSADDRQKIVTCIQELVDKGVFIPTDTVKALQRDIADENVLRVFATASKNKQILDQQLMTAFEDMLDPANPAKRTINTVLLRTFENTLKNNQSLSKKLLTKLETALHMPDLEPLAIRSFIFLAQRGELLRQAVIQKLLDRLDCEQDPVLLQEFLSSLGSLVGANAEQMHELHQSQVNSILIKYISSDNCNVQKLCIHAAGRFFTISKHVDDRLLEELVSIATSTQSNEKAKHGIMVLFDSIIKDDFNPLMESKGYRAQLKLANLNFTSPKDLLSQLWCHVELVGGLLVQNYNQVKIVLDSGSVKLQKEAMNLLHECRHKSGMTDELLDSVGVLHDSASLDILRSSCLQLLREAADAGKALAGRALAVWRRNCKRDQFAQNFVQTRVCQDIMTELQLGEAVVLDLLTSVSDAEMLCLVQDLAGFVQLIAQECSGHWINESFGLLLERCMLKTMALEVALPCYVQMIITTNSCNVSCLEVLVERLSRYDDSEHLMTLLFKAMYYTSKFSAMPKACLVLTVNNLGSSNGSIRGYAFGILRECKTDAVKKVFENWCEAIVKSMRQSVNVELDGKRNILDLLEVLVTVQFLDYQAMQTKDTGVWERELLTSDIFERFKFFPVDQVIFYTQWLEIEQKHQYIRSCRILSLMQKCQFESPLQVNQLVGMISDLSFRDAQKFLLFQRFWSTPYESFKQDWCAKRLQACLSEEHGSVNQQYILNLAKMLCTSYGIEDIRKLFQCLKSVDSVSAFEDFVRFCSKEKIALESMLIGLENVSLEDMRHAIEAKQLYNKYAGCQLGNKGEDESFLFLVQALKKHGWSFHHLRELLGLFTARFHKFPPLLQFLNTMQIYGLTATSFESCRRIVEKSKNVTSVLKEVNKLVVENNFQLEGKVRDTREIKDELLESNPSNLTLQQFVRSGSLEIELRVRLFAATRQTKLE